MTDDNLSDLDALETMADTLVKLQSRLTANEDALFFLLKLFSHSDDEAKIADGIRSLAELRREKGEFTIAKHLEDTANGLAVRTPQVSPTKN
jgi:hypothetical protein